MPRPLSNLRHRLRPLHFDVTPPEEAREGDKEDLSQCGNEEVPAPLPRATSGRNYSNNLNLPYEPLVGIARGLGRAAQNLHTNVAFLLLEPEAAAVDELRSVLQQGLERRGIRILRNGFLNLKSAGYDSSVLAGSPRPLASLDVHKETFRSFFGEDWDSVVAQLRVFESEAACRFMMLDAESMSLLWEEASARQRVMQLCDHVQCAALHFSGKVYYVLNGFFPALKARFDVGALDVHYYVVEWDSRMMSWADFVWIVSGRGTQNDGESRSLEELLRARWMELGLKNGPSASFCHLTASASPFEAYVARRMWLGSKLEEDPFGRLLLQAGVPEKRIDEWCVDPQVPVLGPFGSLSVFDMMRHTDTEWCVSLSVMLHHFQNRERTDNMPVSKTAAVVDRNLELELEHARSLSVQTDPDEHCTPKAPLRSSKPNTAIRWGKAMSLETGLYALEDPPTRALVINVRRLIWMEELFKLIHEFIHSTAIAVLTLVMGGSFQQARCSVVFVFATFLVYAMHENRWDKLDINNVASLVPLLSDDDEAGVYNPNRLLKALTITTSKVWKWIWRFVHLSLLTIIVVGWMVCYRWWSLNDSDEGYDVQLLDRNAFIDSWLARVVKIEEDGEVLSTQLMVGTFMLLLHLLFEFLWARETTSVMPTDPSGAPWDPRTAGVPGRFRFLGLPSVWFTSHQALEDLKLWIWQAKCSIGAVSEIYPVELALFSLAGFEERLMLQVALRDSKLFDGSQRKFVCETDSEPSQLGLELSFFDQDLQNAACQHPGEYLMFDADGEQFASNSNSISPGLVRRDVRATEVSKTLRNKGIKNLGTRSVSFASHGTLSTV